MANTVVNISLKSKDSTSVNITTLSGGEIISGANVLPLIKFIPTGAQGPIGSTGAAGTASIGTGEVTHIHLATDSVGSDEIINGSVGYNEIENSAVRGSKIQSEAITTDKILDGAVTQDKLANNSVGVAQIIDGTVTRELLADSIINGGKIEDNSILTSKIANNQILTSKLADRNVTGDKISSNPDLDGEVKANNLKLKGSSPATLTGPDSHALQIKSNTTIDFQNTSNTTIASLDQSGNLTISGTVDGRDIAADGVKLDGISDSEIIDWSVAQTENIHTSNYTDTNTQLPFIDEDNMASNSSSHVPSQQSVKSYVDDQVAGIVGSAPSTLDTLNELADALGDDENFSTTVTNNIATKAPIASPTFTGTIAIPNIANIETAITANTAKVSFPGLGTTSTTALAGDTALLQLGTSGTTALAGDTTTISGSQASAITANTAKTGITTGQANAITANTAKPDLTVDGSGTINANNVPTLNQSTTGNAATATALAAGNQTIDGDVNIGASQAGHDFTLHGATTQFANILWDASMNHLKVADSCKIVFGNGMAAVDYDSSIQADGNNLIIYNDTGNVQIGDTVEITGNLTITGTVDGIDIATDVAANTAKTSFPGFGTTAGTALEGNTVIPAAYTDAEAVSAVAAADNYIKNDANEVLAGSLEINEELFVVKSTGGSKTRFRNSATTTNRTLDVPDASGTLALVNTHHHFIHAGWFMSYPYARYIPLNGSLNEQNTATSSPEYVNFTFPYDGYVKKMILRSETNMGSTNLKLYKGASGATVTTVLGNVSASVGASAAVEFDFTSVSNAYSKGDTMAIKVDPTEDPDGGQNITIELIFDLTT